MADIADREIFEEGEFHHRDEILVCLVVALKGPESVERWVSGWEERRAEGRLPAHLLAAERAGITADE
jgi:hypothetical protein